MTTEEAKLITKGNDLAASFLGSFVTFCHLMDDIVDKDKEITDQRLVREMLLFLESLVCNPWVRDNIFLLWPLIVAGANAWLDANRWQDSVDGQQRRASDVLKGMYHEVVWFTAFLCGGQQHMQEITRRFREYDFDHKGKV
jgi:hypothetical protein